MYAGALHSHLGLRLIPMLCQLLNSFAMVLAWPEMHTHAGWRTGEDVKAAIDSLLQGRVLEKSKPSMGCGIKWHPSKQPV